MVTQEILIFIALLAFVAVIFIGAWLILLFKNFKLKEALSLKNASLGFLEKDRILLEERAKKLEVELKIFSEKSIILEQENIFLEREKETLQAWVLENSERMQKDFTLFANKIFEDAKAKFSEENKEKLGGILEPLSLNIKQFSQKIEGLSEANTAKHASLVEQIKHLSELNKQVSEDAKMLSDVLKSDNKAAGDWGEMILEKLLESCGLLEGEHYLRQVSLKDYKGDIYRPDIILKLPKDRQVIVDSKVSLVDFLKYSNGELSQELALRSFKDSIRSHIKLLAAKNYQDLDGVSSPEFVMIFIAIEGAFSLVSRQAQELFEFAYKNKVVLASPSTLLTALKTIEFLWRVDKQDKNFLEVIETGKQIYDRVYLFLDRFNSLGQGLEAAQGFFNDAKLTLYEGNKSIVTSAKKLENLGVKINKKIISEDSNG